jgi:hypothetical protein
MSAMPELSKKKPLKELSGVCEKKLKNSLNVFKKEIKNLPH